MKFSRAIYSSSFLWQKKIISSRNACSKISIRKVIEDRVLVFPFFPPIGPCCVIGKLVGESIDRYHGIEASIPCVQNLGIPRIPAIPFSAPCVRRSFFRHRAGLSRDQWRRQKFSTSRDIEDVHRERSVRRSRSVRIFLDNSYHKQSFEDKRLFLSRILAQITVSLCSNRAWIPCPFIRRPQEKNSDKRRFSFLTRQR